MRDNGWITWGKSIFLTMSFLLVVKVIALRFIYFHKLPLSGLLFDLTSVFALTVLIELSTPQKAKKYIYWSVNLLVSVILFVAAVYFQHFGSVPTYMDLTQLHQVPNILSGIKSTITLWDFVFFIDFIIAMPLSYYGHAHKLNTDSYTGHRKSAVLSIGIICIGLCLAAMRIGHPIANELKRAELMGFWNYQVSVVWNKAKPLPAKASSSLNEVIRNAQTLKAANSDPNTVPEVVQPKLFGIAKGMNLIIVQMEAFQNFAINLSINGQEITPVFNQLEKESYYFPHIFYQIGPGNTSDAEFMSNTSIYPTGTMAMSTEYGDRALPSLPRLLEGLNYEADTFHVNDVSFWDRDKLYPALNFSHYFDKPSYENDHFNSFGASDENLYQEGIHVLSGLQAQGKPFYAQFVTVSSHYPFTMPRDRVRLAVPDAIKGTQLGNYLEVINYTDYAVGTLISELKAKGLWDHTVFVAYGDHFGLQPKDNDPVKTSQALGITYDPVVTRMNIPLFIHVPSQAKAEVGSQVGGQVGGQVVEQVGGQVDIMPTVANLLGVSLDANYFTYFGHDLFNITHNVLGVRYYLPTGSFFNDDIVFVPGKSFSDGKATSLSTLQPVADFQKYRADYDYILQLERTSDDYVKALPYR